MIHLSFEFQYFHFFLFKKHQPFASIRGEGHSSQRFPVSPMLFCWGELQSADEAVYNDAVRVTKAGPDLGDLGGEFDPWIFRGKSMDISWQFAGVQLTKGRVLALLHLHCRWALGLGVVVFSFDPLDWVKLQEEISSTPNVPKNFCIVWMLNVYYFLV